nr:hypothetical protein [Tanacetum cinerariifolium]
MVNTRKTTLEVPVNDGVRQWVTGHVDSMSLGINEKLDNTRGETVNWNVYEEAILKRFRDVNEDPMAKLISSSFSLASLKEATLVVIKQRNTPILPTPRGCGLVFRIRWLSTLGTIQWNFKELIIQFYYEGHKGSSMGSRLQLLNEEYTDVFAMPKGLLPHRSFDHKIPLKESNVSVNVRPYRYPLTQKDTIEVMVKELLDSGVIRPIKDKFPIPLIKELIDELHGAQVFSKLDFRSGYHQIRMCDAAVYMTAFRSHEGHYEFVVMNFGLTNAPSTFQALMSDVFKPFLRKFTLVFFDDILVYSPSMIDHIDHLRLVLQTIRNNTVFVKKYKYVFGTTQVEYLGHVISAKGVSTDQILQQNKHLIAYLSKTLAPKHQFLSTYGKEMLAMVLALQKWRGYLLNRHFKIRTDHFSLKYVLEQRVTTQFQSKLLPKLLGFDYVIEYKKGADNEAVDALFRIERQVVLFSMLAGTSNELMDVMVATWSSDFVLKNVIEGPKNNTLSNNKYVTS